MAGDTIVFLHAHPDDEAIFTGGTIAELASVGHRVVVVVATRGELGEVRSTLETHETVVERRDRETRRACEILGVARFEQLGYHDSGMAGDPTNDAPESFFRAVVDEAAAAVASIVAEEGAVALVTYDAGGIYGHPDHVQAHRVGVRAAELAGVETLYQATVDREYLHFVETHLVDEAGAAAQMPTVGVPTVFVTTTVDVRDVLERKREAIAAHASQVPESSSAMALPDDAFSAVYGYEWYVRSGPTGPIDDLVS